jgi:hypothetical protein
MIGCERQQLRIGEDHMLEEGELLSNIKEHLNEYTLK